MLDALAGACVDVPHGSAWVAGVAPTVKGWVLVLVQHGGNEGEQVPGAVVVMLAVRG